LLVAVVRVFKLAVRCCVDRLHEVRGAVDLLNIASRFAAVPARCYEQAVMSRLSLTQRCVARRLPLLHGRATAARIVRLERASLLGA
jgi:hypothetical protein